MRTGYNAWFMEGEAGVSYMKAGTGHKKIPSQEKVWKLRGTGKALSFQADSDDSSTFLHINNHYKAPGCLPKLSVSSH